MKTKMVLLCLLGAAGVLAGSGVVLAQQGAAPTKEIRPGSGAGQWVYLDEDGNKIAPAPEAAAQPAPPAAPESVEKAHKAIEDGGFLVDLSHVRAYSSARVEGGEVHTGCTTKHVHDHCTAKE